MNAENLLRVADAIEKHEIAWLGFNMDCWFDPDTDPDRDMSKHGCKTTACIAGWAAAVSTKKASVAKLNKEDFVPYRAREFLDLSDLDACRLFYYSPQGVRAKDVTPAQAVRTLRYAAEHGVIDWDAAQVEAA